MSGIRTVFIFAFAILLMTGCAGTNSGHKTIQQDEDRIYSLPAEDQELLIKAGPQDLIQQYFAYINSQTYDKAIACLDPSITRNETQSRIAYWKDHYKSVKDVLVQLPDYLADRQSADNAFYQVTYRLEMISGSGTESEGKNERYFHIERNKSFNRWMITGIGTSI